MTYDDYRAAREFIEKKSLGLMSHEKKNYAKVGFPIQNFRLLKHKGRTFYIVLGNVFKEIISRGILIEACQKYPENFGTGNAYDVIEAIYKIEPWGDLEDFAGFLGSEQFCYLLENVNGVIDDKILRVDLFRMIQPNENGGHDFTGGLFHANRHFSYKGFPLSTSKEKHNIFNFDQLLILICEAFFVHAGTFKTKSNYSVTMPISGNDNIRFEFFYEQKNGVYFLNTAFKQTD